MDNVTFEKVEELEKQLQGQKVVSRSDNRLLQAIEYWKRANGVKDSSKRGTRGSKLYEKYSQEERKDSMFRGNMAEVIAAREEALNKTLEEQEEELKEEVEAQKAIDEDNEDDKQVLANSEKKTTKRKTTRKKND